MGTPNDPNDLRASYIFDGRTWGLDDADRFFSRPSHCEAVNTRPSWALINTTSICLKSERPKS